MHSPWGWIGALVEKTGWSLHYILWKVSRTNLMAMMADKPDVKYQEASDTEVQQGDPEELFKLI